MPWAASGDSSRNGVPGSSRRSMRSRARSFPRVTWRALASSLPPCIATSSLARRSATSPFIASVLSANSRDSISTVVSTSVMAHARVFGQFPALPDRRHNGSCCPPASARLVEQLPADQHAPDLAGAGADLVELGVAQIPPSRVVIDVPVSPQKLNRIERDLGGVLGSIENGAGGVLARGFAPVARLRHRIDIGLARIHGDIHVGDLALDELKLADGLAELLTLVNIGHDHVHAGLHDAERPGRQYHPLIVEAGHQDG